MKKEFKLLCMTLSAAAFLTSCLSEEHEFGKPSIKEEGKGTLVLNLNANTEFSDQTRAGIEDKYKNTGNYDVTITNTANNNTPLECKGSDLADNLPKTLDIGSYKISAKYGKEQAASRDEFLVTGESTFNIKGNRETQVTINCAPTCGKITVAFDNEMATYYENYSVSFGGTEALGTKTISWKKDDTDPWYVALNEKGETVEFNISLKVNADYQLVIGDKTGAEGTVKGKFTLERNKAKKLIIKPNYTPTTEGGLKLNIIIDESTSDHEITYDVPITWI